MGRSLCQSLIRIANDGFRGDTIRKLDSKRYLHCSTSLFYFFETTMITRTTGR